MLMTFIAWLVWLTIGTIVGGITSLIQRRNYALMTNIIFGILGAFIGGEVFNLFGLPMITDFNPLSILGALVGAVVILVVLHALKRRRVVAVKEVDTPTNAVTQPLDRREALYESVVTIDRRRIPIWVPIVLIILLPVLEIVLFRITMPDISATPAPFGTVGTYGNDQGKLEYVVYAPPSYQQGTALPLLLLIHGCTQDPYKLETASGMRAIADQNNFMIVYPQQNAVSSPHRCWNWYDSRNQVRDNGEPSLLVGIVKQVQQNYSVDANRIYVAGISSGGAMTSILASCYPDVFAAASVHSGMSYDASNSLVEAITAPLNGSQTPPNVAGTNAHACAGAASQPIPMLIFHGTADRVVDPQNAQDTLQQFAQTNDYADDNTDNDSVVDLPTNVEMMQVAGGHAYKVENYEYDGELLMQRYIVDGLSHMWSGGTGILPFSDPAAPNASQIMWDFFKAHRKT